MTPAYITPPREKRAYKFSLIRMILMGLMLFALITVCLYLYHVAFREYGEYLTAEEKKSTAWIVRQLSFMLPFIAVAAFQCAVYAKHDNRDGILQRERAYEILVAAALTYLVLLPLVVGITYEINRYVGRHDNAVTRFMTAPGLWLQNFTTNEPDDSMIEVGIEALKLVLPEEKGKDA